MFNFWRQTNWLKSSYLFHGSIQSFQRNSLDHLINCFAWKSCLVKFSLLASCHFKISHASFDSVKLYNLWVVCGTCTWKALHRIRFKDWPRNKIRNEGINIHDEQEMQVSQKDQCPKTPLSSLKTIYRFSDCLNLALLPHKIIHPSETVRHKILHCMVYNVFSIVFKGVAWRAIILLLNY